MRRLFLVVFVLLAPALAWAQPPTTGGPWFRDDCTTLTAPTAAGLGACWGRTLNALFGYDGTGWQSDVALATKIVNIKDPRWGAKDDNSANNTTAIQNAVNSGQCVWVPLTASSFNFVGPIALPAAGACLLGGGYNGTLASTLKHTGSGDAFTQNVGGILANGGNLIAGLNLVGTAGASVNAFRLEKLVNAGTWRDMAITGFASSGAAIKTTGVNGGVDDLTLINVFMQGNSACAWTASTGADSNSHWRIIGGSCQGQVAPGGRSAAWDFGTATIQDLVMLGVDTNANKTPRDMYFGGVVSKVAILGGNFNATDVAATAGILFDTGSTLTGITISTFLYHSIAAATGRAIHFKANCTGCVVSGNSITNYAAAANSAIDPGGFDMVNSNFCCNSISGAGTPYGTFGANSVLTLPNGLVLNLPAVSGSVALRLGGNSILEWAAGGPFIQANAATGVMTLGGAGFTLASGTGTVTAGIWNGTTIGAGYGGTGLSTYAVGDLLYASGATTLSKLADVAAGSYLRSGGVTTAPLWSTLVLPNAATTGDLVVATGTNTWGAVAAGTTGQILRAATGAVPAWSTATYPATATTTGAYLRADGTNWIMSTLVLPNAATSTRLVYASAANTYGESASLVFSGTVLGVGTTTTADGSAGTQTPLIALPNAKSLGGENAAGGTIYPLISLNASNKVLLDQQALGVVTGGGFTFGLTSLTSNLGGAGFNTITAAASAPGAGGGKLEWRCGTNAGTIKIVAYGGTSSTGVTVTDNIGAGVTGC